MAAYNPIGDKIESLLKKSPKIYTVKDLATQFDLTDDAVRGIVGRRKIRHLILPYSESQQEIDDESLGALKKECIEKGIDVSNVKYFWHKSKHMSMFVVAPAMPSYAEVRDEMIERMKKYSPKYKKIERKKNGEKHLLVIDPADIHIGKLSVVSETGYDYNIEKAVKDVEEGVSGLLEKAKGFDIDKILLIIGNDVLHVDNIKRTTTGGTPQDTDGQWHEAYQAARDMYVRMIELLLQKADVDIVFNPSNHDYMSGYMLADALYAWFHECKQVKFDNKIISRKYYVYGDNLIATSHGDGASHNDMPLLMAQESAEMWGNTKYRYIYLHHLHHNIKTKWQSVKDYPGITLEVLRSPSAPDGWHSRKGFTGAPRAIEGFIHHKNRGQVAKLTHILD